MGGIHGTFTNIAKLIASLYPGFIILFLLLVSIFNSTPLKGIIYFSGISMCHIIWFLLTRLFPNNERDEGASLTCDIINFPSFNYKIPNRPSMITWFTLIYLILPMAINASMLLNPSVIFILSLLTFSNMYYQYTNKCSNIPGILFGTILGGLLGVGWITLFWKSNKKDLLFYNELASNNVVCNKPSKQTFKCSVYKNGEVISSNVV